MVLWEYGYGVVLESLSGWFNSGELVLVWEEVII